MSVDIARALTAPEVATTIRRLWHEALRTDAIDERCNFLEAGGNSMSMVHMLVAVTAAFDCELDYETFVRIPTLTTLEALVTEALARRR